MGMVLRRPTTMARIVPKGGPALAELAGVSVSTTRLENWTASSELFLPTAPPDPTYGVRRGRLPAVRAPRRGLVPNSYSLLCGGGSCALHACRPSIAPFSPASIPSNEPLTASPTRRRKAHRPTTTSTMGPTACLAPPPRQ